MDDRAIPIDEIIELDRKISDLEEEVDRLRQIEAAAKEFVAYEGDTTYAKLKDALVANSKGEWAGPIPEPKEPESRRRHDRKTSGRK